MLRPVYIDFTTSKTMKKTAPSGSSTSAVLPHPMARKNRPAILAASIACALGLAGSLTPSASAQNLILNGGFETVGTNPNNTFDGTNFVNWTATAATDGNSDFGLAGPGFGSANEQIVFAGNWAAAFGAEGTAFDRISQTVHNLIDQPLLKGVYQVGFWLRSEGGSPEQFQAVWNGHVIYNTTSAAVTAYQHFAFNEVATGTSATLAFQALNNPNFYYLDNVSVELVATEQGSFAQYAASVNMTPNQRSVAAALDSAVPDPKSTKLITFLDYESLHNLPGDFDRISPSQLTSIFTMSTALDQVQSQNIQRRTDDIRSGSSGFSAAGLAINGDTPSFSGSVPFRTGVAGPSGDDGKESKEVKEVAPTENRWGAFLSGTGEWASVGDTNNARGYDMTSGGFTLGVDYKVTPNLAIGLMGGYTGLTADLADHGRVDVNGGKIGLYGTGFVGGWYADVAATGGYNSYDTRRAALQGTARGDTDGGDFNALFGTGYDFKMGGLTFGPTATFNYTYTGINGFNESGSLAPLSIHSGDADSLRTAFGFKASYDWKVGGLLIKPELRAAWQHEFGDAIYSLDSNFANGAGDTFAAEGPKIGRDSLLVGAGFAIQCSERCAVYFYYDGDLARQNYESNAVTGGVRVSF